MSGFDIPKILAHRRESKEIYRRAEKSSVTFSVEDMRK